ncbi:hypothetical protein ABPG74_002177 [Tetrahymena malaccensis]
MKKVIFATVGTTEFDELLTALVQPDMINLLAQHKFTKMVLQKGRGKFQMIEDYIKKLPIEIELFDFKPTLTNEFQQADFVISHCGAGTLLEGLILKKKICAVVNSTLMDNHQEEILNKLLEQNYIYGIKDLNNFSSQIKEILEQLNKDVLKEYPNCDDTKIAKVIESFY